MILTIQDVSCVGQCSLTVALPIISACGIETAILPSAVLSTHTGGFSGWTFRDLTADMPKISEHWTKEGIKFDAVYTGYLGSIEQIDISRKIMAAHLPENGLRIIDPAMADNGKLYTGFSMEFVEQMAQFCGEADYVLPNITEASFMTGLPYKTEYDEVYVRELCEKLAERGAKNVVLTGVSYNANQLGIAIYEREAQSLRYYMHEKLPNSCHGTGDIYASAFTGALVRGKDVLSAVAIAAKFVIESIRATPKTHTYGACFEKAIPTLIAQLGE